MRIALAALLLAGAAAVPAHAAAPELAGTTTITASTSGRMTVRLPVATRIAVDPAKAVSVAGNGRLVGLFLTEQHEGGDRASWVRLPSQLGYQVYGSGPTAPVKCDRPLPGPAGNLYTDCSKATFPTYFSLHRGTYTLSVLADSAPVTFTLRILNYTGSTELAPTTRLASVFTPLETAVDPAGAAGLTWVAGAAVKPTRASDLFTVVWWRQDDSAYAEDKMCWQDGDDYAALGAKRWALGCVGGSSIGMSEVTNPVYGPAWLAKGGRHGGLGTAGTGAATTVGTTWWTKAQGVRDVGGFSVWLESVNLAGGFSGSG